jgi:hypothetical protein
MTTEEHEEHSMVTITYAQFKNVRIALQKWSKVIDSLTRRMIH